MDYTYYRVIGGKVKAAFDRFVALREEQHSARKRLMAEFGASGIYANEHVVEGFIFKNDASVPAGWKPHAKEPKVHRPHGPGADKKALRARFRNDYPLAGIQKFQDLVIGERSDLHFMSGLRISTMGFELIGEALVLLVPKIEETPWSPPDAECVPIRASEYWTLKEVEAEAVKKGKAPAKGV